MSSDLLPLMESHTGSAYSNSDRAVVTGESLVWSEWLGLTQLGSCDCNQRLLRMERLWTEGPIPDGVSRHQD